MNPYDCDDCGTDTPDGAGLYPDEVYDYRVCRECYVKYGNVMTLQGEPV